MNRIRSERALKGITQQELADMLDVAPSTVIRWESGGKITQDYIVRMHDVFGCTADWLLGLTDERIPVPESGLADKHELGESHER